LDPRVNPGAEDDHAIRRASQNGRPEVVQLLLADPRVNPDAFDDYAVQLASENGHADTVDLLLSDTRVNPTADNDYAIRRASQNGRAEVVQLLLADLRVDPGAFDDYAVQLASENGHADTVAVLLSDDRVNPGAKDDYAIGMSSNQGHADVVKLLLSDPWVNPAAGDDFAISAASENGHTEVVQMLLSDPRVNPAADDDIAVRFASDNGHPETISVLLNDSRVSLTTDQSRTCIHTAVQNGFVDVVSILLTRFPLPDESTSEVISLCAEHGLSEILMIVLLQFNPQHGDLELSTLMLASLQNAHKHGRHEFVLELVTQSTDPAIAKAVMSVINNDEKLFTELTCMHVDVLRVLLSKYKLCVKDKIKSSLMNSACQAESVDVVQELLDNHQDQFGDWTVDDFNSAALRGNMPVLQLLSFSRYGGCKKLAVNPPLNRICTQKVLGGVYVKSSFLLMWCIKKKTTPRTMAKLLDVLRDLVSSELLRYEMN
jgi:ankyrin repeat protein